MKRSELYAKVWSTPVSKLADEVGVSGSRIARVCKRHRIPTPPRGYWAKFSGHTSPPPPPLPKPEDDYDIRIGPPAAQERSPWLAPGVLLRREATEAPQPAAAPLQSSHQLDGPSVPLLGQLPQRWDGDLELVRAAASELQDRQAIQAVLQAVAASAVHALPEEAQRILEWTAAVRAQLEERDPIKALLRRASRLRREASGQ